MRIKVLFLRFVMFISVIVLGFSACENSKKDTTSTKQDTFFEKTYTATDLNDQEYTITGDLQALKISPNPSTPTLLILSDLNDSLKDYIPAFNLLKKTFKERLRLIVLLNKPYLATEIKDFISHSQANFIVLNPKDTALFRELNTKNNHLQTSFNMLLYSKHKLIHIYQGVVPAEMLQFDISNLKD
ncbi:hypothetical protein [Helicobacter cetorum]|uniref:Lipoprotein n=1 Tax=Helicobacter cetorum (strain ATCC BAA-540 / CCUG 52418 / MIT 99-5656) TaxID=1163745 RepID=I0ETW4_HELCM|nr:hypothetical protein [Helicobacter cetorum]AFI06383.1 hypothetical protein HCD_06920 [Helicobacter cetorum MIT 99-5656]